MMTEAQRGLLGADVGGGRQGRDSPTVARLFALADSSGSGSLVFSQFVSAFQHITPTVLLLLLLLLCQLYDGWLTYIPHVVTRETGRTRACKG